MKKLLIAIIIPIALMLGACNPQEQQFIDQYKIVLAPDSMYNCPKIQRWPEIKTLKDVEVARLIVEIAEARNICDASLQSIKKYYQDAKIIVEKKNKSKK